MIGTVESLVGWPDVLADVTRVLAHAGLLAAVLVYPWPKGVGCRGLQVGLGCLFAAQVLGALSYVGVLRPTWYFAEAEIPVWREILGMLELYVLHLGGGVLAVWGGWAVARRLAGLWGGSAGKERRSR